MTSMVLVALPKLAVRLDTLGRGRSPAHPTVNLLSIYGMQAYFKGRVTWSTKDLIIRNPPLQSILNPTEQQKAIRYLFGYYAHNWQNYQGQVNIIQQNGKKFATLSKQGRKLPQGAVAPVVAAVIQAKMKGTVKVRPETEAEAIRKGYRKGYHTYEEFEEAARKLGVAAR